LSFRDAKTSRNLEAQAAPSPVGSGFLASLGMTVALLFGVGCHKTETPPAPKPIILISIDTLRSDHLPAYGYQNVATPAIDALRADGILFSRAYSHVPLTLPSHATILSGRLPAENGLRDNAGFKWRDGVPSIAELLQASGYATGAAVSSYALRTGTGIERGFQMYDDNFAASSSTQVMGEVQRSGLDTERIAENWISGKGSAPFFFFLHLYEPHSPYTPPEPYKSRYPLAYDGEIAAADAVVGQFIAFLKRKDLYNNSTVILLSDHGEGLGDHGEDEHGLLLYREALQVPLIVKPAGATEKRTVDKPAQLVDVFATIAAIADLHANSDGTSLLDLKTDRRIFAETYFPRLHFGWSDLHSAIDANNHLIRGARSEMFDLASDPAERHDISSDRRREVAALRTALDPMMQPVSVAEQITPEEAKKLAALGYIGSSSSNDADARDPRDEMQTFNDLKKAWGAYQAGHDSEAAALADAMLQRDPKLIDMWQLKAMALDEMHRPGEAMDAARRGLALNPKFEPLLIRAGYLSIQLRQFQQADTYADLVMAMRPSIGHDIRARSALATGNIDAADTEARAALTSGRESPDLHYTMGRVALARNDPRMALAEFDAAQRLLDKTGEHMRNLNHDRGFVLEQLGRDAEAGKAFQEEIRLFPGNVMAYTNLIVFYATHGRVADEAHLVDTLITKYPSGPSYAAIAEAMRVLGNQQAARKALSDGLSRYPDSAELAAVKAALH
jgi:tetratricopeptide (TPR) repeat protein